MYGWGVTARVGWKSGSNQFREIIIIIIPRNPKYIANLFCWASNQYEILINLIITCKISQSTYTCKIQFPEPVRSFTKGVGIFVHVITSLVMKPQSPIIGPRTAAAAPLQKIRKKITSPYNEF